MAEAGVELMTMEQWAVLAVEDITVPRPVLRERLVKVMQVVGDMILARRHSLLVEVAGQEVLGWSEQAVEVETVVLVIYLMVITMVAAVAAVPRVLIPPDQAERVVVVQAVEVGVQQQAREQTDSVVVAAAVPSTTKLKMVQLEVLVS
jgi:hypothetical protein